MRVCITDIRDGPMLSELTTTMKSSYRRAPEEIRGNT